MLSVSAADCYCFVVFLGESCDWTAFFNWPAVRQSTDRLAFWNQSPFDITQDTLPIAMWDSICSNYNFLPSDVTLQHHAAFGQVLIGSLLHPSSANSPVTTSVVGPMMSLHSISEAFLTSTTNITGSPALHAALVRSLELSLKQCIDRPDSSLPKKSTKKRLKAADMSREKSEELLDALRILGEIGFSVDSAGVMAFSLSLIWKAFHFLLEHHESWTANQTLTSALVCFSNLLLSVPSKDAKYWTNVLSDFTAIRTTVLTADTSNAVFTLLNQQCSRILTLIADSGSDENLRAVWEQSKTTSDTFLLPLILDVLLGCLTRPGSVRLAHEVVTDLFDRYLAPLSSASKMSPAELLQCTAISTSIQSAFSTLQRIGSKQFAATVAMVRQLLSVESVHQTLDAALVSGDQMRLNLALRHLALYIEVRGGCKIKTVKRVLSLFAVPAVEVAATDLPAAAVRPADLNALDDAALFRLLVSMTESSEFANYFHYGINVDARNYSRNYQANVLTVST